MTLIVPGGRNPYRQPADSVGITVVVLGRVYFSLRPQEGTMDLIGYWKKCVLENYANFSGRARRSEFWSFALANLVVYVLLLILMRVSGVFVILYIGFAVAMLVPSLAVAIRRLHDTGKTGWMLLVGLIPIVGGILLLVWYFTDSDKGSNTYGVSEKYPG
jgi:uncharacterized membrane protein YhaH (DUF805 family)